eukprot:CAMPEP_0181125062 /NCGR_PEP_ID=MMETSP1071-20121207/26836_1 /TAXON_ID=35127 /ORGANISM="Thalassiosira sp., Strain NH16" /LENGTH=59 /DNA_ID=CAMNT_0023210453 /DNA_START=70 /DNA_END=245 /DNA_ORIENTATION=+
MAPTRIAPMAPADEGEPESASVSDSQQKQNGSMLPEIMMSSSAQSSSARSPKDEHNTLP